MKKNKGKQLSTIDDGNLKSDENHFFRIMNLHVRRFLSIVALVSVYYMLHITCPFRGIFHMPCPTCGLTRAWLALFQGGLCDALYYHPLFFSGPLIVAALCMEWKREQIRCVFFVLVSFLLLITYVIRIFYFMIP